VGETDDLVRPAVAAMPSRRAAGLDGPRPGAAEPGDEGGERGLTIADIARAAGVSVPTVSKVINGRTGVSRETRRRVAEVLKEHDYAPRRAQRNPTRGVLELVFGELNSPWALEITKGVEQAAFAAGLGVLISRLRSDAAGAARWLEMVTNRRSDGIIFAVVGATEAQRARFQKLRLPFVVIDPEGEQDSSVPTVGITHWRGGYAATEHLLGLGHRRVALLGGPPGLLFSAARANGFRSAMDRAGVPVDPALVVDSVFNQEAGMLAAERLLSLAEPPTAIFAASDEQAFGVYEAARRRGLSIPRDLSVVGFNDSYVAHWASPPLTTVREPIDDMCAQAIFLLLRLIRGHDMGSGVELATELIVRSSTAPPR
jgi:LacI family transcriptional regulator